MIYAPHILQIYNPGQTTTDSNNDIIVAEGTWETVGGCRCDDNGAMKQIGINGIGQLYNYHVVYEGPNIPIGTKIRCLNGEDVRGEGKVLKSGKCNFLGYSELWV